MNNINNNTKTLTIQDIIDYVDNMKKIRINQEIENIVKEDEYKPLVHGKMRALNNLPKKIKKYFENISEKTLRLGITSKMPEQQNITFFVCLLYCLDSDYSKMSEDSKEKEASELKSHLAYNMKHSKIFESFKYNDFKWKRKDIIDDIATNNITKLTIRYVIDYFNINLFILDTNNDTIIACYPDNHFDIYKNTIIMSLYNYIYEPIFTNDRDQGLWKYSDTTYKIFINNLTNNISNVEVIDFNPKNKVAKSFMFASKNKEQLKKYLNLQHFNNKYYLCLHEMHKNNKQSIKNSNNEILCNTHHPEQCNCVNNANVNKNTDQEINDNNENNIVDTSISKMEINDLKKMKIEDLSKFASSINIATTLKNGKNKTKTQLIIDVCDYYKTIKSSQDNYKTPSIHNKSSQDNCETLSDHNKSSQDNCEIPSDHNKSSQDNCEILSDHDM